LEVLIFAKKIFVRSNIVISSVKTEFQMHICMILSVLQHASSIEPNIAAIMQTKKQFHTSHHKHVTKQSFWTKNATKSIKGSKDSDSRLVSNENLSEILLSCAAMSNPQPACSPV